MVPPIKGLAQQGNDTMTYRVGDTVVYPHHGAAVIEKHEKRTLEGQERDYLVLRLTYGDLTLMVPADATTAVGLRDVVSQQEVDEVFGLLRRRDGSMPTNWSRRFKANYEKLKSGDIFQVAEVVRNLSLRERDKGLSAGEKRMLTKARQILVSELSAAVKKSEEQTEELIDAVLSE
jgi:CarD family transcriptional regulator, regulator of rRNA transcription